MKFSESWLREWVKPAVNSEELAHQITMAGLEVDDVEAVAGESASYFHRSSLRAIGSLLVGLPLCFTFRNRYHLRPRFKFYLL